MVQYQKVVRRQDHHYIGHLLLRQMIVDDPLQHHSQNRWIILHLGRLIQTEHHQIYHQNSHYHEPNHTIDQLYFIIMDPMDM